MFGVGGQFDGRFQTPDKYTSYHRFGQDPLTGRITPNRNELKHTGLQVDVDWDISDKVHFQSTTAYRDFDTSFGRDSDGTPLPGTFTWDTSKHEQFTQEFELSGLAGSNEGSSGPRACSTTTRSTRTRATTTATSIPRASPTTRTYKT